MSRLSKNSRQWRQRRGRVFVRDGYKCCGCGRVGGPFECDHIVPLHKGGTDDMDNLQTLCRECHMDKTWRENGHDIPGRRDWADFATASRFKRARF